MKVLVKAVAGSHLFGLNTEKSDKDYKGVFVPDAESILLGEYDDTIRQSTGNGVTRNTKDDVDCELYSIRKFFKMLRNGDTAALELLFTPDEFIIESSPTWKTLVSIRDILVSKKINALIGYTRQQANRYGLRGSRMGELNNFLKLIKQQEAALTFKGAKLKHIWDVLLEGIKGYQHIHLIELQTSKDDTSPALDILGKKFDHNSPISVVSKCLSDEYKRYGERAREAKNNNGIDFKALSHAVRCMIQGIELMNTGSITLPHTAENKELLLKIKKGEMTYLEIEPIIEQKMEELEKASNLSNLREEVDEEAIKNAICTIHAAVVLEFDKSMFSDV